MNVNEVLIAISYQNDGDWIKIYSNIRGNKNPSVEYNLDENLLKK